MMRGIAAHENEGVRVGRSSREPADMADAVAGRIEKVEAAIAEVVERIKAAYFEPAAILLEVDLTHITALKVRLEERRVLAFRVSRCMSLHESRPNHQFCGVRKGLRVALSSSLCRAWYTDIDTTHYVIPMVMAPDNRLNRATINIHPILLQNLRHVLLDINTPFQLHPLRI